MFSLICLQIYFSILRTLSASADAADSFTCLSMITKLAWLISKIKNLNSQQGDGLNTTQKGLGSFILVAAYRLR